MKVKRPKRAVCYNLTHESINYIVLESERRGLSLSATADLIIRESMMIDHVEEKLRKIIKEELANQPT